MKVNLSKYTITFSTLVLEVLERFTQYKTTDNEKGGIVLGKMIDDEINLTRLSVPTELDRSTRYGFERHRLSAQIVIDHEFVNSHGQVAYLGEWHTHPEDIPSPSPTDMKMIKSQFANNRIYTDYLLMIIKGRKAIYVGLYSKTGLISSIHNLEK